MPKVIVNCPEDMELHDYLELFEHIDAFAETYMLAITYSTDYDHGFTTTKTGRTATGATKTNTGTNSAGSTPQAAKQQNINVSEPGGVSLSNLC